jgi:superfamily I DNA and/or RNA helicase
VRAVIGLLTGKIKHSEVGVITFYSAQRALLRSCLFQEDLEVSTVDGFQGREKDYIVISTVRANSDGDVGFLADYRRLNVALTRARKGLIVIGCAQTLKNSEYWARWIEWAAQKGAHVRLANDTSVNIVSA